MARRGTVVAVGRAPAAATGAVVAEGDAGPGRVVAEASVRERGARLALYADGVLLAVGVARGGRAPALRAAAGACLLAAPEERGLRVRLAAPLAARRRVALVNIGPPATFVLERDGVYTPPVIRSY